MIKAKGEKMNGLKEWLNIEILIYEVRRKQVMLDKMFFIDSVV